MTGAAFASAAALPRARKRESPRCPVRASAGAAQLLDAGAAVRAVMGGAHVFEGEMGVLAGAMARLEAGDARAFVRRVAKSAGFRRRYFERCGSVRFVELCFKNLLGRAPEDWAEVARMLAVLRDDGYDAVIDDIVDSDEYDQRFGDELLPAMTVSGAYKGGMPAFCTQMKLQLQTRGANTDASSTKPVTVSALAARNAASPAEIAAAYAVTYPRVAGSPAWNALPQSSLFKDWASAALVLSGTAGNWSGSGTPRPAGVATEEWSSGWAPAVAGNAGAEWSPGWRPSFKTWKE